MKKFLAGVFAALHEAIDRHDVIFAAGLGLLGYGLYAVYWPLGFIVPGGILTWFAFYTARPAAPSEEKK